MELTIITNITVDGTRHYKFSNTIEKDNSVVSYTMAKSADADGIIQMRCGTSLQLVCNLSDIGLTYSTFQNIEPKHFSVGSDTTYTFNVNVWSTEIIKITTYKNSSEPNRLDKTSYLTAVGPLYGTFREPTSLTAPSITIQQDAVPTFNYIYIPTFNRYYYVTEITSIRKGLWQIDCTVDVLMSYKDAIMNCRARVERNEYDYNDNIPDDRRIVESGSIITDNQISNTVFNTTGNYQYVMNGYKLNAVVG